MKTTTAMLSNGMKPLEQRLNGRLLRELAQEFARWKKLPAQRERRKLRDRRNSDRDAAGRRTCNDRRQAEEMANRQMADFLLVRLHRCQNDIRALNQEQTSLRFALREPASSEVRNEIILRFAVRLGRSDRDLKRDRAAFARWFDEDALLDRLARRRGRAEQQLTFVLERFGALLKSMAEKAATSARGVGGIVGMYRRFDLERCILNILESACDPRVHAAALTLFKRMLDPIPQSSRDEFVSMRMIDQLMELATSRDRDVWLQCRALDALRLVAFNSLPAIYEERLSHDSTDDDMFVRRHVIRAIAASEPDSFPAAERPMQSFLGKAATDSSVFVRQRLAEDVWRLPVDVAAEWVPRLIVDEQHPQVIACALAASLQHVYRIDLHAVLLQSIGICLQQREDKFVLRTAIHVSSRWLELLLARQKESATKSADVANVPDALIAEVYRTTILPSLRRLQFQSESVPVRRWAAKSVERIELRLDPVASQFYEKLMPYTEGLGPGDCCCLPHKLANSVSADTFGRTLAVMAQDEFGFDVRNGFTGCWLIRQPNFGFRFWRMLFELWRPATDKRQAFRHTIGRLSRSTFRVPSQILSELSRTKVPGEPFMMAVEGDWRPYLPLADDFLSAINNSLLWTRTTVFFTSQGVTRLTPPPTWSGRCRAWCALTWRFAEYADARDWEPDSGTSPRAYLEAFEKLGFQIEFRAYADNEPDTAAPVEPPVEQPVAADETVERFFSGAASVPFLPGALTWGPLVDLSSRFQDYFFSLYDNTLPHLLVFAVLFAAAFIGLHVWSNVRLSRARRSIPLSLGGWGTRGKSGTERLKAALINSLGHGLISKTTGCEAMFIHADAFCDQREVPLFRPYDKATIWEQVNVIRMAAKMNPSVFLWECMGLSPAYVDVLQRQWTVDDMATVTNTYPDHEDIQGPAGYNVACTIGGFVPVNSHVITTEQEMRPILRHNCEQVGTSLRSVGWLESGLISDDVLNRFPYQEHPDNIALVAAMADELGVPYDVSLKGMADDLVPDLGVLQTYPDAHVRTRTIEFTNGMSANERFGCIGNWSRTGFAEHDPHEERGLWVSTVVNNRADRVARSRVFASILVNDIEADRHFLIGTNLKGMSGFIAEELEAALETLSLFKASKENESGAATFDPAIAHQSLQKTARSYRQPTDPLHIRESLRVMFTAVDIPMPAFSGDASDLEEWLTDDFVQSHLAKHTVSADLARAIERHHQSQVAALKEYRGLCTAIDDIKSAAGGGPTSGLESLDTLFRDTVRKWFERKIVVVHDADSTGEQVLYRLVEETPPGVHNRAMGLQNIKGTGLDFIYRFQDWKACHEACDCLHHADPIVAQKGLEVLVGLPVIGQLCEAHVRNTISTAKTQAAFQDPAKSTTLDTITDKVDSSMEKIIASCTTTESGGGGFGLRDRIADIVEALVDANDAVRRRAKADRIYVDMTTERISRQRAIEELRKINKRQKGGWVKAAWAKSSLFAKKVPARAVEPTDSSSTSNTSSPSTAARGDSAVSHESEASPAITFDLPPDAEKTRV